MHRDYRPVKCVYEATLACNMRCRHCGSAAGGPRPDELDTDEAVSLLEQLAELGCRKLVISGGEPTLRPDWPTLVERAAATGMRTGLFTNGVSFDRQRARTARDSGAAAVGFSVDGIGETHDRVRNRPGHFEEILAAMECAAAEGLPFSVVTHVNRLNIDQLSRIESLLRERGSFAWQLQPAIEMGSLRSNPELAIRPADMLRICAEAASFSLESELRIAVADTIGYYGPEEAILRSGCGLDGFNGCGAGTSVIGIESNGNVKGCLSIEPGHAGDDYVEGNVRDEPLEVIWNRPGAFFYNRDWSPDQLGGFCRACEHAERCRGGCRSMMTASGEGVENPFCAHRVLAERRPGRRARAGSRAAAAVLAAAAGAGSVACGDEVPTPFQEVQDAGIDAGADSGTDSDSDSFDTETGADTDTQSDSEVDTDTETGHVTVYMFCMEAGKPAVVPVETRCGGPDCFRVKLRRMQHLKQGLPKGPAGWG